MYEQLFDLKFRISPLAFFQANTKGAELLYKKVGELSQVDENTVVLDVCCGTGTIGLTLASVIIIFYDLNFLRIVVFIFCFERKLN